MKFLYTTDLHGNTQKYCQVLTHAKAKGYKLIHLGADLLPVGLNIAKLQKRFVKKFLKDWYQEAKDAGIHILCGFGNDDLYSRKKYFSEYGYLLEDETIFWNNEDGHTYTHPNGSDQESYFFRSYNWVPVHPFGLLNGCKLDKSGGFPTLEPFINPPRDLTESGSLEVVPDVEEYLNKRGAIEEDLKNYKGLDKLVMAFHGPPTGLGLDVCDDGRKVGSVSIRNWIEDNPCALVLCGHIHESPRVSGIWKAQATNGTWVVQPGQTGGNAIVVEVDTDNLDGMTRRILE